MEIPPSRRKEPSIRRRIREERGIRGLPEREEPRLSRNRVRVDNPGVIEAERALIAGEQPEIVPPALRNADRNTEKEYVNSYYDKEADIGCKQDRNNFNSLGELDQAAVDMCKLKTYWIQKARLKFGVDISIIPSYNLDYYKYLAYRVDLNVDQILGLLPLYFKGRPFQFGFRAADLGLYDPQEHHERGIIRPLAAPTEQTRDFEKRESGIRSHTDELNLELLEKGFRPIDRDQNIIALINRLNLFFLETSAATYRVDQLFADARSASLILSPVVANECNLGQGCYLEVDITATQPNREYRLQGIMSRLKEPLSENPETAQRQANQKTVDFDAIFINGPFKLTNGQMIRLWFNNRQTYFVVFYYQGKFEVTGSNTRQEERPARLPNLFAQYLRLKGLISPVAAEIYTIMPEVKIYADQKWV